MTKHLVVFTLIALAVLVGCTTEEADESHVYEAAVAAGETPVDDLFHADVTLYRRYTGDKWLTDKDHQFTIKDESHVRARVRLEPLETGRTYSVHLCWIKPDSNEMYRRYAEVTRHEVRLPLGVLPDSTGALPEAVVAGFKERWGEDLGGELAEKLAGKPEQPRYVVERLFKDAEDLHDIATRCYHTSKARVDLFTRLNISREKERPVGDYLLRIYLDRRLLKEVPFTLQDNS